jgi:hypothetical protein
VCTTVFFSLLKAHVTSTAKWKLSYLAI